MSYVGFLQGAVGIFLAEAGVDDAALLVLEALGTVVARAGTSSSRSITAVHQESGGRSWGGDG